MAALPGAAAAAKIVEAGGIAATDSAVPQPTDRDLVAKTLGGDKEAFALLHRRYYVRVYRLALLRCGCPPDAEDIAGETFVRAITHLAGYRFRGESLFPWLSRICLNLVADRGRQRPPAALVSLDASAGEGLRVLLEALPGDAPDPHMLAERHEVQMLVRAAVANLPPDQMNAIMLRFVGDLPLKEIAHAMGKTEGAIKALLHRAMIGLRKALLQKGREAEVFGDLAARTRGSTFAASSSASSVLGAEQEPPPPSQHAATRAAFPNR